jgi:hypothetical protein
VAQCVAGERVGGQPVFAAERQHGTGNCQWNAYGGGDRERQRRGGDRVQRVGDERGRAEQQQLPRGETEGELVLQLDVGRQLHAIGAHVKSAFLPTRAST